MDSICTTNATMDNNDTELEIDKECKKHFIASLISIMNNWQENGVGSQNWAVILSGGVDTGALMEALRIIDRLPSKVYTLIVANVPAPDRNYARRMVEKYGVEHVEIECAAIELLGKPMETCIKSLKIFDPMELRNCVVACAVLDRVHQDGITHVLTGDGSDELLGGYSFMFAAEEPSWTEKRNAMCRQWTFSTPVLGRELYNIKVESPYTHKTFTDWAVSNLHKKDCIALANCECEPEGTKKEAMTGKLPLRRAFPGNVAAWRRKDPMEVGSGTTIFGNVEWFREEILQISSKELACKIEQIEKSDNIQIRDAEHYFYYQIFRRTFKDKQDMLPQRDFTSSASCKFCHYQLQKSNSRFCTTCGGFESV